ncbi:unnamed protein product [Closterium sp. NIES-53]
MAEDKGEGKGEIKEEIIRSSRVEGGSHGGSRRGSGGEGGLEGGGGSSSSSSIMRRHSLWEPIWEEVERGGSGEGRSAKEVAVLSVQRLDNVDRNEGGGKRGGQGGAHGGRHGGNQGGGDSSGEVQGGGGRGGSGGSGGRGRRGGTGESGGSGSRGERWSWGRVERAAYLVQEAMAGRWVPLEAVREEGGGAAARWAVWYRRGEGVRAAMVLALLLLPFFEVRAYRGICCPMPVVYCASCAAFEGVVPAGGGCAGRHGSGAAVAAVFRGACVQGGYGACAVQWGEGKL